MFFARRNFFYNLRNCYKAKGTRIRGSETQFRDWEEPTKKISIGTSPHLKGQVPNTYWAKPKTLKKKKKETLNPAPKPATSTPASWLPSPLQSHTDPRPPQTLEHKLEDCSDRRTYKLHSSRDKGKISKILNQTNENGGDEEKHPMIWTDKEPHVRFQRRLEGVICKLRLLNRTSKWLNQPS